MPCVATVFVLAYFDSRHPPRGPKAQTARMVLMQTKHFDRVSFTNEGGKPNGWHGGFQYDSNLHVMDIKFGSLGARPRWYRWKHDWRWTEMWSDALPSVRIRVLAIILLCCNDAILGEDDQAEYIIL